MRATFSWLFVIDGGFRLGLFLVAGLLFEPNLQLAYALGLIPMAIGLYAGNKVHLDITTEAMLKVVGALLVVSGGDVIRQSNLIRSLQMKFMRFEYRGETGFGVLEGDDVVHGYTWATCSTVRAPAAKR